MDLLDPQSYNLHSREDIKKGVYVKSLQEETVTDVQDMMYLTNLKHITGIEAPL